MASISRSPVVSPLRIAILGAGRIGSTFAFQLASLGHHELTVIARPGSVRLHQLQRDGGILNIKGKRANVNIVDTLDERTPYDLVIVTVLSYHVHAVLTALKRSAAKSVLFMFNTFETEHLRQAVGSERCAFGMPFVQANFDKGGRLIAQIGAGGQKTLLSQARWVDLFNSVGLPAVLEPDMPLWLRCHTPLCVAFESISVAGVRRGGGASWSEALVIARGVQESFALIKGLGYPIYPKSKARLAAFPVWALAGILWTLSRIRSFRELLASGERECCALVEAMIAAAPQANPSVAVERIHAMKPK